MKKHPTLNRMRWILSRLTNDAMGTSIAEDLAYRFVQDSKEHGPVLSRIRHGFRCVVIILPLYIEHVFGGVSMLKNYLKIALRHIKRYKGYSIINITGLAIGMTCTILIFLWVQSELSFDRYHENADRIYRVYKKYQMGEETGYNPSTPLPLASAAKQKIAGIQVSTKYTRSTVLVKYGDKIFTENRVCCADTSFFNLFTFQFIKGHAETALSTPNAIVMTRDMETKYFGGQDPMGKVLTVDNRGEFIVTGVVENAPVHSELRYDFFIPISFITDVNAADDWGTHWLYTYVMLEQNANLFDVEQEMSAMIQERLPEEKISLHLQPLTDIHLYSLDGKPVGMRYVYFFSIIAIFILAIACINFMNLTTAYSLRRAREVGLRKTVGAEKKQIALQFFGESLLFTCIAMGIAFVLLQLVSPAFNDVTGRSLALDVTNLKHILGFFLIVIVTGLLSGAYPALFLSSFRPADVFKGSMSRGMKGSTLRKILVIIQFSLSIALMISTSVIYSQLDYIKNTDKGYTEENVLYLYMNRQLRENYQPMKNELLKNPGIKNVSRTSELPNSIWSIIRGIVWEGKETDEGAAFGFAAIDEDYIETMQMEIVQGRNFSKAFPADSANYILNQKAIAVMGYEDPIGRRFTLDQDAPGTIIGVVKDFHSLPLNYALEPFVLTLAPNWYRRVLIRVQTDDMAGTLRYIENVWSRFVPGFPFEYGFLDERFDSMYDAELRAGKIFGYFVVIAIFISCMGLFGLSSFTAEQKTKEIGVRKILGASTVKILYLLSKEFMKWVLLANVIAWPMAYVVMTKWLQNFAYRAHVGIWVFAVSALAAILIALFTVSYQSIRAATSNPVDSLRYE